MARTYHHGNLRPVLLATAAEAIEQDGPAALSLRDLARRAGVSHAAPAHHFGDKAGLLTALATEGYDLLAEAVGAADDIVEAGLAYIRFAVEHRGHFEVMFQPDLYRNDDPDVVAARERAGRALTDALAALPEPPTAKEGRAARLAAWSIVHGFAGLWIGGVLPADLGDDPAAAARPVISRLFQ
ncbi:TetR/AcrR family transcriptional regulator [Rugosimonospora acidiphila]|uniref:TetR/AcrR family transcriptional regulator n=1 Tax=Rugosimonospora acidiphila TaxID=556531 RepID=A0ABP9S8T9_9ACTN